MSDDQRRKGLGRGLSALLDEAPEDRSAMDRIRPTRTLPIESLSANPYQPRRHFDDAEMANLVESIRANGVLQPILVRRQPGDEERYEIIAGERRWRASQMAQLHEVPVIVKELTDTQALEFALVENIQRQDLTPLEEAEGYRRLLDEFHHTQEQLGRVIGKSRSHVANMLRLLGLPASVKEMLQDGRLSAGHGRALLASDDPEQIEKMAADVVADGLSVRETERLAQGRPISDDEAAGPSAPSAPPVEKDANIRDLERQLSERLGLKVVINHRGERGDVRISYNSLEQFDEILARLRNSPAGG